MKIFNWIVGSFCRTLGRFLFYIAIGLLVMFVLNGSVNAAVVEGCYKNGSNLNKEIKIGSQYVGTNYYYSLRNNSSDQSVFTADFCGELRSDLSSTSGTTLVPFQVEYCTSATEKLQVFSSYYNYVDFVGLNGTEKFLTNEDWTKVKCYTAFVRLRMNYVNNIGTNLDTNFTNYTDTDNQFYVYNGIGYDTILGYKNIIYYDNETDYYNALDTFKATSQNQTIIDQNTQTNEKLDTQINQNQDIINNQNSTNDKLNDLNSNLTNTDSPNFDSLQNSAGWLPAGPVDSILNLPLSLLNNLTTNLNKSCQPVILPIPYVNKNLTLPCVNTLYDDMGISAWVTTIGVIASAFIMLSYLLKLYRWVDDTLTFRENNQIDNWGGI